MASAAELAIIIRAQNETTAVLKSIQNDLKQTEARVNSFGASLKRMNETAAGFIQAQVITRGLSSLQSLFSSSITAASSYNESLSKTRVVFGDLAGEIEQFASTSAQNLGISRQATLEATATFGNLFTAMRIGRPAAAEMSQNLVKLAADLASFNNLDPTEVLVKLRAGLVGEAEPLRTLGINLNEVTIKNRAMQLGLVKSTDTLTAAQKAQAAYSLILEQSATAQGDFARTADGTANKTRIMSASFSDLKVVLGQELEPTFNRVIGTIISKIQDPAFQEGVRGWVREFRNFGSDVADGFNRDVIPAFEWIIDNEGRVTAAIIAIGLAFAWVNPVAAGLAGITLLLANAGKNEGQPGFFEKARTEIENRRDFQGNEATGANIFGIKPGTFGQAFDPSKGVFNSIQAAKDKAEADRLARQQGRTQFPDLVPPLKDNTEALKSLREALGQTFQGLINLDNISKAVSALFGKPTREQADLELFRAEQAVNKARFGDKSVSFGPGIGRGTLEKTEQRLKTAEAEHTLLKARITAANSLLITEGQLATEAGKLRDLTEVQSSLIRDKLNPSVADLYPAVHTAYEGFTTLNTILHGPQSVVAGLQSFARELAEFKLPSVKDPNNPTQALPFNSAFQGP